MEKSLSSRLSRARIKGLSFFSQFFHFIVYRWKEPKMQLEKGSIIISVDVDVGCKELGVINKGQNNANVNDYMSEYAVGEIEERALPLFVDFFNNLEIPVTFAIRGQLLEVNMSFIALLLDSPIQHEIGSHGYYHRDFTKLSRNEAEDELKKISMAMKKNSITPKSFVFPRNGIAHLDLLEKYGYKCYRGYGGFLSDGMYVEKRGELYDIHPSLYIGQSINPMFIKEIIDISIRKKLPLHLWFHPWDFGVKNESIQRSILKIFSPLFEYAKKKRENNLLSFETMLSTAIKFEKMNKT